MSILADQCPLPKQTEVSILPMHVKDYPETLTSLPVSTYFINDVEHRNAVHSSFRGIELSGHKVQLEQSNVTGITIEKSNNSAWSISNQFQTITTWYIYLITISYHQIRQPTSMDGFESEEYIPQCMEYMQVAAAIHE